MVPLACHVGQVDGIEQWWHRVEAEVGVPTVLVNNAGTNPYFGPMLGGDWRAWDKTFEVNLKGPFEMTRQFVQRLMWSKGLCCEHREYFGDLCITDAGCLWDDQSLDYFHDTDARC